MDKHVILYYGEDSFFIKSKIKQTIQKYDFDDFNITYYDLEDVELNDAINDAMTIPFMSEKKLIVCQNAHFLGKEKTKKASTKDTKLLLEYLQNPTDTTLLIITTPVASLDEKNPLVKSLKMHTVVECKLVAAKDLVSWARRQVGNMSMHIDDAALKEFVKRVQHSTEFAYLEMKKLLMYAHDTNHIDLAMVERVITKNIEDNIYEITNALLEKNTQKALSVYHDLVLYSEDPLRILNTIIHKYREILHVKTLLEDGKNQQDIQEYYRVSSGRAYYMVQNARAVDMENVKEHLRHLERLDYHIKTGRVDKKTGLELFILSI